MTQRLILVGLLVLGASCNRAGEAGHDHGHAHGAGESEAEEAEPLAITKWTAKHELFVEFPAPVAGTSVPYHAHVTKLEGFRALTAGTFRVRYKTSSGVAAETKIDGVKRAGIFTPEGPAPASGTYALEMVVESEGGSDVFDCGSITIAEKPPAPEAEAPSAAITFLKESQWKIPFATAWAGERSMAKELELPATVEAAGTDQLVIGAPTGGRFFHNPKLSLAEGQRIEKGEVIGSISPTVAGDDFSRLQLAVDETRIQKEQAEREIQRVEPLVKQELLPERRLIELRNERDTLAARLASARSRVARVLAPGGAGGVPIKSSLEGIVSQVLAPNGEPVEAGAALVRVGGTKNLWLRTRFVARPPQSFVGAKATGARLPSGQRVDLEATSARLLSALPVVDSSSQIATWVVEVAPGERDLAQESNPLQLGASLVLLLRVGTPRTVLSVPRLAVVEINTRSFVFVQVDGEHFEKRAVVLGDADGGFIEIKSGIQKGERIVTLGGFDIHLASLMGTVESHRH
jgi:membrane fusion protein, heavy metal efflux system